MVPAARLPAVVLALAACAAASAALSGCVTSSGSTWPDDDAGAPPSFDLLDVLLDPAAPARALPGVAHLESTRYPEAAGGCDDEDWSHFVGSEGARDVILDAAGPGVVTRIWATARLNPPDPAPAINFAPVDGVVLHVEVDGREVAIDGRTGRTLGELASGDVRGFPHPWVLSRTDSSGGLSLLVPIHFQRSLRLSVERGAARDFFDHVDWRSLPSGTTVRSFDGVADPETTSRLAAAQALWQPGAPRGSDHAGQTFAVDRGASATLPLPAGVLAAVRVRSLDGTPLDGATVDLVLDGVSVLAARPLPWIASASHAAAYGSALSSADETHMELAYPSVVRTGGTLVVHAGDVARQVRLEVDSLSGRTPDGLGALRAQCVSVTAPDQCVVMPLLTTTGHVRFAGSILSMKALYGEWTMLEGDHEILCDDHALLGTGTEDYYGAAFYFWRGPFAALQAGAYGVWTGHDGTAEADVYRHHLVDGVECARSLSFRFVSYAVGQSIDGCAFYYSYD